MQVFTLNLDSKVAEELLFLAQDWPLSGIWEDGAMLKLFAEDEAVESIEGFLQALCLSYQLEQVEQVNWNAKWESDFKVVRIADFCQIYAGFHQVDLDAVRYNIRIEPRMAFGTGHHETTAMLLEMMSGVSFVGKRVLDYGCGTGILGILAEKMGARHVIAIDNDSNAYENTLDNIFQNACERIVLHKDEIEFLSSVACDVILANINYGVLIGASRRLLEWSRPGTELLLSGILAEQADRVRQSYESVGWNLVEEKVRGDWIAQHYHR